MKTRFSISIQAPRFVVPLWVLLLAAPAAQAQDASAEANDRFGDVVARGDFNGDKCQDLAVGLPLEDITNGPLPQINGAGAVEVIYGTVNGLASPNRQFWRQGSAGVEDAAEDADLFGRSLATGDFNNDGYDDLAIGVSGEDIGTIANTGAVNVLYGSSAGLNATTVADQFWHQNVASVADASEPEDQFGWALATGDFNNDGYDDLAIGVIGEDIGSIPEAGAVNVIYGSSAGLNATTVTDQFWHQNVSGVEDTAEPSDMFGASSLATGDFNNDGYDDLAIGVVNEDVGSIVDAGAVSVIHGSSTGLSAIAIPDQIWHQDVANVEDVAEAGDAFARSLSTGDFNGDGFSDLAIGVRGENAEAGAVNVLHGSSTGLSATTVADQFWSQDAVNVEDTAEPLDRFGWLSTTGDFNGDGWDDLAIAAPLEDVAAIADAGAVNVLYGSPAGLNATIPMSDQFWHQDVTSVEDVAETSDAFGWSLTAGDFNNDGLDDLAIGAPGEDLDAAGGPIADAGAVSVIYGYSKGLNEKVVPDQLWTQSYIP